MGVLLFLGRPFSGVVEDVFDPGRWSVHPVQLSHGGCVSKDVNFGGCSRKG